MNRIEKKAARPLPRKRAVEVIELPRCGDLSGSHGESQVVLRDSNGVGILVSDLPLIGACWRYNRGEVGVLERELARIPGYAEATGWKETPEEEVALVAMADEPSYVKPPPAREDSSDPKKRRLEPNARHSWQSNDNTQAEEDEAYQIRGQSIVGYSRQSVDEGQNLLGNRWLERGRGVLLTGPSGIGKSTAIYQMTACWGCGQIAFAIRPAILPGLRVTVFQTEDSPNDLVEMSRCINRLGFSEGQLRLVERNTHIETINDAVGARFIKKVDSFLQQKPSDLIILNPLSDFIPGELIDEAEVKKFLRQQLNPLLENYQCGVLCVQPTTKTNLQNTDGYSWFDWQYWAAGSAEFARWARGGLVIVPTPDRDTYRFIAAKRFEKIGWLQPENWFSHSVENDVDLWVPASEAQIVSTKKKSAMKPEDVLTFIPLVDPISQESYFEECSRLKIGENRARRFVNILADQGKIELVKLQRDGAKSAVGYRRTGEK